MEKITVPPILKIPKNKPPFFEDIENLQNVDPTFATHTDFDWSELEHLLGEARELDAKSIEKLADCLRGIIAWCIASKPGEVNLQRAALRIVALAWVIDPNFFEGASLAEVSRRGGLKTVVRLAEQSGAASRVFGIRNPGQSHSNGTWKKN